MLLYIAYKITQLLYTCGIRMNYITSIYAFIRYKRGIWDEETTDLYRSILSKEKPSYLGLYYGIEYLWKTTDVLKDATKLLTGDYNYLPTEQRAQVYAILASIFYKSDRTISIELQHKAENLAPHSINRYLQLVASTNTQQSTEAKTILRNLKPLEDLLNQIEGSQTIAIVGNAPTELNKSKGSTIDEADVVVRFNRFSTDKKFHIDYGKRCDLWVVNPAIIKELNLASLENFNLILSSTMIDSVKTSMWTPLFIISTTKYISN